MAATEATSQSRRPDPQQTSQTKFVIEDRLNLPNTCIRGEGRPDSLGFLAISVGTECRNCLTVDVCFPDYYFAHSNLGPYWANWALIGLANYENFQTSVNTMRGLRGWALLIYGRHELWGEVETLYLGS